MDMRIYKPNAKRVKRCPFCGDKPEDVWVMRISDTFYRGDLLHDCSAYITMHITRYDDSPETVIDRVLDVWNGRED
jgi:hypothetical protein